MEEPQQTVSFILPALNEAEFITSALESIDAFFPDGFRKEKIVVDNGSTDGTPEIAKKAGADMVIVASGNVGRLRNAGAEAAQGHSLVFLDADVVLTREWKQNAPDALMAVRNGRILTGSWCVTRDEASSWIERDWFGSMQEASHRHMNSGHCIISRDFFRELNGFDESLRSGEDVDLSERAVRCGGIIQANPGLRAIHLGYPRTLREFFVREIWHGSGDFASFGMWVNSPIAIVSAALLFLIIAGILGLLFGTGILLAVAIALLVLTSICSAWLKLRPSSIGQLLRTTGLFCTYFVARGLSLFLRNRVNSSAPSRSRV